MCKIGVLDSGVGGLSVLRLIHQLLPELSTIYFADQAHVPYGPRPADEIDAYVMAIARDLIARGAAVVVVACHAASAASLYHLRREFPDVQFVGIEPAVKPAVQQTRSGTIGVLTTAATAKGKLYQQVLARFASDTTVMTQVAPELVTLVEEHQNVPKAADLLRQYLEPMLDAGADHVVLACTHFPFLIESIQAIVGPSVAIVDPAPAVARQVARVLPCKPSNKTTAHHVYLTSGDASRFSAVAAGLLGHPVSADSVSDIFLYG